MYLRFFGLRPQNDIMRPQNNNLRPQNLYHWSDIMAMLLSFEINNNIKIIEASKKGGTLSVFRCMTIDGSCVMDGKILDMDRTVNAIKKELESKGIKTRKAIILINSSRIMVRKIKLPLLKKDKEILSMLQIELQQTVRADLSRYRLIYVVSDVTNENKISYAEYIVYCIPEDMVNDCHELAARLKLRLLKVDIIPACINELYKNGVMINDCALNKGVIEAYIDVHDGFVSFSAAKNGICDFHISSKPYEAFHEKEAKLPSLNNTFVLEQVIKYLRYYYSVSGNRTMDKVYTYGICDEKINEAIKAVLHINSIIIDSLSCLPKENLPGDFEPSMYFNNVLAFFSNNKELAKNTNYKIKLKKGLAYAAIISIIAAATSLLSGFINTRAAIKDEMSKMTSYIDDEKNFEIYREIEKIKSQSEYLMLYLSRAEELKLEMERNDYMDTSIIREIGKLKPFETKITSIHSDKEGIQLLCLSPSMNEAALFFSHLRGLARVEKAYMSSIQSKNGQSFSYSIVLKIEGVINDEEVL
jgi:hypothetical protein